MRDWGAILQKLVSLKLADQPFPLSVFTIHPPSEHCWPTSLPVHSEVVEFYQICDGGCLGGFINFPRLSELEVVNQNWDEMFQGWGAIEGILKRSQHLVFATDAGGCPLIPDVATNEIRAFQFDGGTWESPLASGFDEFMYRIVNQPEPAADLWENALRQLEYQP
ncbi:MAG: SMI1/KNR4 family protein [Blastocatellia bacterium]|nr:SMI1/KNR4 family protein [Blastocatellia bacterium]